MEKKVFPWPSIGGYDYFELISWLQKAIRKVKFAGSRSEGRYRSVNENI